MLKFAITVYPKYTCATCFTTLNSVIQSYYFIVPTEYNLHLYVDCVMQVYDVWWFINHIHVCRLFLHILMCKDDSFCSNRETLLYFCIIRPKNLSLLNLIEMVVNGNNGLVITYNHNNGNPSIIRFLQAE